MSLVLSPDIWISEDRGRPSLRNVLSQYQAVQLEESELTSISQHLKDESQEKLLAGHILVEEETTKLFHHQQVKTVLRAVDRYLAQASGSTRQQVRAETPEPSARLELCKERVLEQMGEQKGQLTRDLHALFRNVSNLLKRSQESARSPDPDFLAKLWKRPGLDRGFQQLPCMPETTQRRVAVALEQSSSGACLVLGDDDLISLEWSLKTSRTCDVFEIDEKLVQFIENQSPPNTVVHQRDLTKGLPQEFHDRYQVIFTDPMYTRAGFDMFLKCCSQGLKADGTLYLNTRPDLIDDGDQLEERLALVGLQISHKRECFSRYLFPKQTKRDVLEVLKGSSVPNFLLKALVDIPYYYSDLLEVKRIE